MATSASSSGTVTRQRLAQRRKTLGLTQEALTELLGVERFTVIRWEHGDSEPVPWILCKLAKALRVPANQLAELLHNGGAAGLVADVPRALEAWQHALAILGDLDHPDADEVRAKLDAAAGSLVPGTPGS